MKTPPALHPDLRGYLALLGRLAVFAGFALSVCALPGYLYHRRLQSVGEAIGSPRIADISRGEPALWASGFYDTAVHKPEVAQRLRPRIAAVGSSRVMQWRAEMFTSQHASGFYNLGGGATNVPELTSCVDVLLAQPDPPGLVLIGVDWWWLQHHRPEAEPPGRWHRLAEGWRVRGGRAIDRVQLYQQAWRDPRVWEAWAAPEATTPTGRVPWGINARTTGGFRNDGSYSYWHFVTHPDGPRHTDTGKRRAGIERIDRGDFAGPYVHAPRLGELADGVRRLRARGVEVVLVLPPIEPGVLDHWLDTPGGAGYLPRLRDALGRLCRHHDAGFADYTDPRPLGYGIDHFIDWFHGGEAVYAAMLLDMARRPDLVPRLAPYLDPARLERALEDPVDPYRLYPG